MSKTCERCNGSGIIKRVEHDVFGNNLVQVSCPVCNGTGKIDTSQYLPFGHTDSSSSTKRKPH